jgi:hypothetical protein
VWWWGDRHRRPDDPSSVVSLAPVSLAPVSLAPVSLAPVPHHTLGTAGSPAAAPPPSAVPGVQQPSLDDQIAALQATAAAAAAAITLQLQTQIAALTASVAPQPQPQPQQQPQQQQQADNSPPDSPEREDMYAADSRPASPSVAAVPLDWDHSTVDSTDCPLCHKPAGKNVM